MEIACPHCNYKHIVSSKCTSWSDHCWGCGAFFDWRLKPAIRPIPKSAAQQGLHTDAVEIAASKSNSQAGSLSASKYDA